MVYSVVTQVGFDFVFNMGYENLERTFFAN